MESSSKSAIVIQPFLPENDTKLALTATSIGRPALTDLVWSRAERGHLWSLLLCDHCDGCGNAEPLGRSDDVERRTRRESERRSRAVGSNDDHLRMYTDVVSVCGEELVCDFVWISPTGT